MTTLHKDETFEAYQSRRIKDLAFENGALDMTLQITLAALLRADPRAGLEIMRVHGVTASTAMVRGAEARARAEVS